MRLVTWILFQFSNFRVYSVLIIFLHKTLYFFIIFRLISYVKTKYRLGKSIQKQKSNVDFNFDYDFPLVMLCLIIWLSDNSTYLWMNYSDKCMSYKKFFIRKHCSDKLWCYFSSFFTCVYILLSNISYFFLNMNRYLFLFHYVYVEIYKEKNSYLKHVGIIPNLSVCVCVI